MLKPLHTLCLLAIGAALLHTQPAAAQTLDPAFAPTNILLDGNGFSVRAMLPQPDGKVVVGGNDDFLNGVLTSKLRRLNADGSPDAAFLAQTGTGPDIGMVQALALQADGKIVAGVQSMTSYSGVPASGIVRLNADGSVDAAFNAGGLGLSTQPNASYNGNIRSLAVQADGKILVGTWPIDVPFFYYNGQAVGSLLRLNTDGSLDPSFNLGSGLTRANTTPAVEAIVVQADGKILVGGRFDALNGTAVGNLVRLNANGSIDASFAIGSGIGIGQSYDGVRALAQQADGKLLVGGGFGTFDGAPTATLFRLNLNGTLDNTFQGSTNSSLVLHLRPQANGSILLAGNFRRYNGAVVGGVARLSSTGALDASFVSGAGITTGYTYDLLPIANGQYLVGGGFTDYSGTPRTGLARLTSTAALDLTYNPVYRRKGNVSAVGVLPNGQLRVQGTFNSFNGTAVAGYYGATYLLNANGTYNGPAFDALMLPNGQLYRLTGSPTGTATTLTRLLANGTTDASFAPAIISTTSSIPDAVNLTVRSTVAGGVFLLGNFATVNGTARAGVARLLPDGTLDAGFAPAQPWSTNFNTLYNLTAASLPNNQALIGWSDTQGHLMQLTATGAPDPAFSIGTAAGTAYTFTAVPQPDGRLLVSGPFTSFNGQAAPGLLRLLPTGAPDATFVPALTLDRLLVQPDGRILGTQNSYRPTNQLRRLNADGSLDASFAAVSIPEPPYYQSGLIGYLLQPADGKILLYGAFTTVNGQPRIGLARLTNTLLATRPAFAAALALAVFPNPAQQQATLRIPAAAVSAIAQPVLLLDMQGRTVRRFTLPAGQSEAVIALADVTAGVYLLQTTTGQGPVRQRVVVTR